MFLIFTTVYAQYAVEGFELNAVDYLQKPFTFSRFEKALQKVNQLKSLYELERSQTSRKDEIDLMVEYKHVTVNWNEISFIWKPWTTMSGFISTQPSRFFRR